MTPTDKALLDELVKAHRIILNALSIMTVQQQVAWASKNDHMGLIEDGTTRYHERAAVILAAGGVL